jgi:hypothetical protein
MIGKLIMLVPQRLETLIDRLLYYNLRISYMQAHSLAVCIAKGFPLRFEVVGVAGSFPRLEGETT